MASIYKRDGKWRAEVNYKDGGKYKKKTKSGFKTKAEANAWASSIEVQKSNVTALSLGDTPFIDYYTDWVETHIDSGIKEATARGYRIAQETAKKYFDNYKLNEITRIVYQRFINDFASTHAVATVKLRHSQIGIVLKQAFHDGIISVDPTYNVKFTGSKSRRTSLKYLEESDFFSIVHYIEKSKPDRYLFALFTMALSGVRSGEVLALTRDDIDETAKTISITKSKTQKVPYKITTPKTKSSIRTVTMPDKFFDEYRRYIATRGDDTSLFGDKANATNLYDKFVTVQKNLGIEPRISPHGLRHTHASYLIAHGIDISYISERLGHKDVGTTQQVYLHLLKTRKDVEIAKTLTLFNNL
ncbi:tyrosine-type recombinase/integrase [Weissella cibaria]|uniref:tyrosine-type recombinase/integrase n=1 Tax=Weissella cibaria TaxID=137591 RepID=UPI0013DB2DAF|nr:site-specific integrase [Weissella cibaria]NFA02990.1 site-specific integrase [Weissella cibaria]